MQTKETFDHFMKDLLRVSSDLLFRAFGNTGITLLPTVSVSEDKSTIEKVHEVQVIVYDIKTSQINLLSESEAQKHEIFNHTITLNMDNLSNDIQVMKGVVDFSLALEQKLSSLPTA